MESFIFPEFLVIGLVTGILSGLFGVGGGFILIPLLVAAKVPVHLAVGTSLGYVTCTSVAGAYKHFRYGNIHLKTATLLIMVGSLMLVTVGIRINNILGSQELKGAFSIMLIATAFYFFLKRRMEVEIEMTTKTTKEFHVETHWLTQICLGSGIGLLSGIFGVGGGFLLVPVLVLVLKMPMKLAVGTSLFVIIFSSLVGAITHALHGSIDFPVLGLLVIGGITGAFLGANIAEQAQPRHLENTFIALLLLAALYMLYAASS